MGATVPLARGRRGRLESAAAAAATNWFERRCCAQIGIAAAAKIGTASRADEQGGPAETGKIRQEREKGDDGTKAVKGTRGRKD